MCRRNPIQHLKQNSVLWICLVCLAICSSWIASPVCAQNREQSLHENVAWGENEPYIPRFLLSLIHAPEVHQELKLNATQVEQLETFFRAEDGRWFRSRNLPTEQQNSVVKQIESAAWNWCDKHASGPQRQRLAQLELQAQSIRALLRDDVQQQLKLNDSQTRQLLQLAQTTDTAARKLQEALRGNSPAEELQTELQTARQKERTKAIEILTAEQKTELQQLLGSPFETGKLKRIYPLAPELIAVEHWINSDPLKLESLRGKVVLLHFYAFQCHNCHANFDVYQRWHDKFGDDVVVLGIQTPETRRERDPAAVRQAARDAKLKFPILVDLKSENWQNWSNTMWPTVYVIDQKGYLRSWWQGELRWQGATGDQTIEKLVEELIAESE